MNYKKKIVIKLEEKYLNIDIILNAKTLSVGTYIIR